MIDDESTFESRLAYDSATGVFTWRNGRRAGRPAGSIDSRGYLQINLNKRMYLGLYNTELEAHEAYAKALREAYGEFARVA